VAFILGDKKTAALSSEADSLALAREFPSPMLNVKFVGDDVRGKASDALGLLGDGFDFLGHCVFECVQFHGPTVPTGPKISNKFFFVRSVVNARLAVKVEQNRVKLFSQISDARRCGKRAILGHCPVSPLTPQAAGNNFDAMSKLFNRRKPAKFYCYCGNPAIGKDNSGPYCLRCQTIENALKHHQPRERGGSGRDASELDNTSELE
jgi:hypothetical protein